MLLRAQRASRPPLPPPPMGARAAIATALLLAAGAAAFKPDDFKVRKDWRRARKLLPPCAPISRGAGHPVDGHNWRWMRVTCSRAEARRYGSTRDDSARKPIETAFARPRSQPAGGGKGPLLSPLDLARASLITARPCGTSGMRVPPRIATHSPPFLPSLPHRPAPTRPSARPIAPPPAPATPSTRPPSSWTEPCCAPTWCRRMAVATLGGWRWK